MPKYIFLFIACFALLLSCNTEKSFEITIDNPTELDFSFTLNEEKHTVNALGQLTLELEKGTYFFQIKNEIGDTLLNDSIDIFNNGILNPSQSTYVVWNDLYIEDFENYDKRAQEILSIRDSISIDDKEYNDVDFDVYENQVFIDKNWDFGIFEDWPEEIDLYSHSEIKKSKIYRLADLEEEWGYWGTLDFSDYAEEEFQHLIDSLLNEADLEVDTGDDLN